MLIKFMLFITFYSLISGIDYILKIRKFNRDSFLLLILSIINIFLYF